MTTAGDDRREYVRIHNEFSVRIAKQKKRDRFEDLEIDIARTINVSAGGLLVSVREPIDMGAIIRVQFLKPNSFDFFEGFGRVVRVEENKEGKQPSFSLGLIFMNLSEVDKKKLNYYLTLVDTQ